MHLRMTMLFGILALACLAWGQQAQDAPSAQPTTVATETADTELDHLRQAADREQTPAEEHPPGTQEDTVYQSGALGLQALNPEISVVGDVVAALGETEGNPKKSDFNFRVLGIHFESYLDPYSKIKATVPVTKDKASLGEAYLTRFGLARNLNLTVGKFHQEFGIVNRWHDPSLDQVELPLAPRQIFGGHLNQTGVSLEWRAPQTGQTAHGLTLQVTNGENPRLFGENTESIPSVLGHYKYYRDLSKDTYLEVGLSGLVGRNDTWKVQPAGGAAQTLTEDRYTSVLGADVTVLWEPTDAMRYRNRVWRSELYVMNKDLLAPDGSGQDTIHAWGAYSYVQEKISRTTEVGLRYDYYQPDTKAYATAALAPLAVTTQDAHQWQLSPYLTWWQSPWVKWRVEYNYRCGEGLPDDNRLLVQCTFAAGPHKHERY